MKNAIIKRVKQRLKAKHRKSRKSYIRSRKYKDARHRNMRNINNNFKPTRNFQQQQRRPHMMPTDDPIMQNSKIYSDAEVNSIAVLVSMILHTDKCTKVNERCDFEQCKFMRNLFAHMQHCSAGKLCTTLLCSSAGYTINHWNNCDRDDCPVCSQFKKKPWRFKSTFVGDPTTVTYIKQELSWTFHALSCSNAQCPRLLCASTKSLLIHIRTCREGKSCERFKCSPLRQILSHWENCHMLNCDICSSFRMIQLRSVLGG